jgi:SAM-dependent methyltransferase
MSLSERSTANGYRSAPRKPSLPWAVRLYRSSVLKQEKFRAIERFLPALEGKSCLDIGGDNGVISYLLREKGGFWHSADLPPAVESIRRIVRQNVHELQGPRLPFPDRHFDLVVVVDYMEHIAEDGAFVEELFRILRPGGELILNVPHCKRAALLRPIRLALGLTDAWHGHVRPGYRQEELHRLLSHRFTIRQMATYSRFFSHAIDTLFGFIHGRLGAGKGTETSKGVVITQRDFERGDRALAFASLLYPLCWLVVQLNRLVFFTKGYLLLVHAEKKGRNLHYEL